MDVLQEQLQRYDEEVPTWLRLSIKEQETQRVAFESMIGRKITLEQAEIAYSIMRVIFRNHYVKMLEEKLSGSSPKPTRKPKIIS